jgi:hypothetical protein
MSPREKLPDPATFAAAVREAMGQLGPAAVAEMLLTTLDSELTGKEREEFLADPEFAKVYAELQEVTAELKAEAAAAEGTGAG